MVFLADCMALLMNVIAVFLFFERDKIRCVVATSLGYFCFYQIYVGSFVISSIAGNILSAVVWVVLCYAAGRLFRKLGVADCLEYFMRDKRQKIGLTVISLVLAESYLGYQFFSQWLSSLMGALPYQTWLFAALFFLLLLYITLFVRHKQKEEMQEMALVQQKMYIGNLEELQREVRMYRHDYKNMVSGLLLQAKDGDTEAVLRFLSQSAGTFDESVGRKIQQTTQLINLRQEELKSLVLSKLMRMQELGIPYHLEVVNPVEEVRMNPVDLNRCVGILLDNAIEEAVLCENGKVELIFSSQKECVTILVVNTLRTVVDISAIFAEDYSTKGEDRGLGLASFERIIRKYKNAISLTRIKNNEFIQELKIS